MPSLTGLFGSHDRTKSPKQTLDKSATPPSTATPPIQRAQENSTPTTTTPPAPTATTRSSRPPPLIEHYYIPHLECKAPMATLAPTHITNNGVSQRSSGNGDRPAKNKLFFGSGGKMSWGRGDKARRRNGSDSSTSSIGVGSLSVQGASVSPAPAGVEGEFGAWPRQQQQQARRTAPGAPHEEDECLI